MGRHCDNCGAEVNERFVRVMCPGDGSVPACTNCAALGKVSKVIRRRHPDLHTSERL